MSLAKKTPTAAPDEPVSAIEIRRIGTETIRVPIKGLTSLIVHKWSEKAKRQMLDAQQGKKTPKSVRNPQEDYESSIYTTDDGYGFPTIAFKAATVSASRFYGKQAPMTVLRQAIFMNGVPSKDRAELLTPIFGEPKMREDMVRVGMGGTDLRYRAEFLDWSAVLDVTYVTSMLSRDSVLSLIDAGGMGVGVGEWRPEKRGQNGTFTVDDSQQIEIVK